MKHINMMENSKQAKVMIMLGGLLKKFSFGANGQLRGFEIVGGECEILLKDFCFVGWWKSDE